MAESVLQDLRLAVRMLAKDRWFTLAAVAVLALGIAATNTVFTLVNGALLRDMPFDDPDQVVDLGSVSYLDLQDWRTGVQTFDDVAATAERFMNVSDDEIPAERFRGAYITANGFALLGASPALGRHFRPDDDRIGAEAAVMLGHHVWRTRYGSDPAVVGRAIRVNGAPAVVIGVMPEAFEFPLNARLWLPAATLPPGERDDRAVTALNGFARLRAGVTREQARAALVAIAGRLARTYPDERRNPRPAVEPFRSGIGDPIVGMMAAMMGAVIFVLLIACANVANLLLARGAGRSREVSVRMSIGASRWRIVRQLLIESLLLALVAGVVALGLASASITVFWKVVSTVADPPPFWLRFPIDGTVFAFLAVVCLGTAILFGLVPALQTSRTNLVEVLNEAGRGSTGHRRSRRWTGALVVGQLALTLVLLTGAGLMMRNLLTMVRTNAGVDTSRLVRMGIDLPASEYSTPDERRAFYAQLTDRLAGTPGLQATLASNTPLSPAAEGRVLFEGGAEPPLEQRPRTSLVTVGRGYFETIGAAMIRGRSFAGDDGLPGREAAVVNQRFVDAYLEGGDPLGRRIRLAPEAAWMTVVGVAANVMQRATESGGFDPVVYLPFTANPPVRTNILVRSDGDVARVASALREQVRALDANLAIYDIRTVDEQLAMSRWGQRVFGSMFAIFAGIALLLAVVGLYAITAYSVAQRTQEIGIRLALGARARQVWWVVTRRASAQLAAGLLLGGAGSLAVTRVLPAFLAGTGGGRPATLLVVSLLLLGAGLAACFVPARRAMRLDPVAALRQE
jgi:predicted permease